MTSERRQRANRENAQKSTGPKTSEGKNASKRNGLKHGLSGMTPMLPPEDEELFKGRMRAWTAEENPQGQVETCYLAAAALASVRIDRCARNEFAVIAQKRRDVLRNWQRKQDRRIERITQTLADTPARAKAQLEVFASGCGWLAEQWEELLQALENPGHWSADQTAQALRLLGSGPDPATDQADPNPTADRLRTHAFRLLPEAATEPAARAAALIDVRSLLAEEIERLSHERAELWYQIEGPDLAEVINLATIDLSRDGALRHRYAVSASSDLHRSFALLDHHQRAHKDPRRHQDAEAKGTRPREIEEWYRNHPQAPAYEPPTAPEPAAAATPGPPFRTEPNEPPSSAYPSGVCVTTPLVTKPMQGPVLTPPPWPSTAANPRPPEVKASRPSVSGP
ncbi:MAG TPA: hypothetical protein VGZ22_07955 [Isosphaeraceae bacterium]|nr:hypothetical protein [Isosphaeraceae bacterium]